jgi:hypothetical protein
MKTHWSSLNETQLDVMGLNSLNKTQLDVMGLNENPLVSSMKPLI